MNILIAFPSRSRPERLARQMKELQRQVKQPDKCFVNFVIDDDDPKRNQYLITIEREVKLPYQITGGKSENKIHAVNRAVSEANYQWDAVVVMSDDMRIVLHWFDDDIRDRMKLTTDALLHYNDGYANHKLITLAIMGRDYYNRFGYVYNPEYVSLWCDNEQMDVADILGRRVYTGKQIVLHEHPANRHNTMDAQYKHTESFYNSDKATYERRKKTDFGLPLLTVCICTIVGREKQFEGIYNKLLKQAEAAGGVTVIFEKDNKEISVGAKRQNLLNRCQSRYAVYVDDDDDVSSDYIKQIKHGITFFKKSTGDYPDCVGFLQRCTFDGSAPVTVSLSRKWLEWGDNIGGFAHVRTPYHKTPIALSKAVKCGGFNNMHYGEDHDFSKRVYPYLVTEAFINRELYYYQYKTENHNTKYGIK